MLSIAFLLALALEAGAFKFGVFGDTREYTTRFLYGLNDMKSREPDLEFVVTLGDTDPNSECLKAIRSVFGNRTRWIPVVGNHDLDDLPFVKNYVQNDLDKSSSLKHFLFSRGPTDSFWSSFSFNFGNVHVVVVNEYFDGVSETGTDGDICPALLAWIKRDYNLLPKDKINSIFVFGHEPAFPRVRHVNDSLDKYVENRDAFWNFLSKYRYTAYVAGHTHVYNRVTVDDVIQIDGGSTGREFPLVYQIYDVTEESIEYHAYITENMTMPFVHFDEFVVKLPDSLEELDAEEIESIDVDKQLVEFFSLFDPGNDTWTLIEAADHAAPSKGYWVYITLYIAAISAISLSVYACGKKKQ